MKITIWHSLVLSYEKKLDFKNKYEANSLLFYPHLYSGILYINKTMFLFLQCKNQPNRSNMVCWLNIIKALFFKVPSPLFVSPSSKVVCGGENFEEKLFSLGVHKNCILFDLYEGSE